MQSDTDDPMADTKSTENTRWDQIVTQTASDFAENTTLNGLKYMAEKGATILERLFWISTFILSTVLCVLMVYKSYVKYDTSSVVVTLKEQLVSVNEVKSCTEMTAVIGNKICRDMYKPNDPYHFWYGRYLHQSIKYFQYPFPAVTICPQARIRSNKYNYTRQGLSVFTKSYEDWSVADMRKFHSLLVFCDNDEGSNFSDIVFNNTIDISKFFEVAPSHEDIFKECSWRNIVDCKKSFRPALTADGICYTFNILATDEIYRKKSVYQKRYYLNTSTPQKGWSLEKNYVSIDKKTFPRRGRANGAKEDLYLTLNEVTDREFACDMQTRPGYKVYLHHPADLPQASLHSYAAQPGKTTSFAIKLDILDTAEELAKYTPEIRQCYFPDERYLQFFQKYTSSNCHLECLTNYTIETCGCASFYMPRNKSTDICKAEKWNCVQGALDKYAAQEDLTDGQINQCHCLPSCKVINYDADVVLTKLDLEEYDKKRKEFNALIDEIFEYNDSDDEDEESYEPQTEYFDHEATNTNSSQTTTDEENTTDENNTVTTDEENTPNQSKSRFTEIKIYYRRPRFVAMERSELVGLSQFLADVGGTLGLFLGFSFLTLAEIFYFFTLKLYYSFRRQNSPKKGYNTSHIKNI